MRHTFGAGAIVLTAVWLGGCVPPLPGGALEGAAGRSGGTGSGASGGNGGTGAGGAACPRNCDPPSGCAEPAWSGSAVSSFESGCATLDAVDGRDGGWFVYQTANSTATPGPTQPFSVFCGGGDGSCFSACVSGMLNGNAAGDWPSVGIGFTPRANAAAYDASRYGGIDFWLRAIVGPRSTLRLLVPLQADTMVGNGDGTCTTNCFDAYTVPLDGNPSWQHLSIPFGRLTQQGVGPPEPWDPKTVISFQWAVAATASPQLTDEPYAICIDQVQLVP